MASLPIKPFPAFAAASATLALAGCDAAARSGAPDPFSATGEMIAYSGGEAGATNACFTCHGLQGEGNGAGAPRLAGLPVGYLVKQMQDFADGRRRDPSMHWISRKLSPHERLMVSAWYAELPPPLAAPPGPVSAAGAALYHQGDPARGLAPCAECHGETGEGGDFAGPPLAGQPIQYLAEQLRRWRRGDRQNSPKGVMLEISRRLTEAEMRALSDYAAALPGAGAEGASQTVS